MSFCIICWPDQNSFPAATWLQGAKQTRVLIGLWFYSWQLIKKIFVPDQIYCHSSNQTKAWSSNIFVSANFEVELCTKDFFLSNYHDTDLLKFVVSSALQYKHQVHTKQVLVHRSRWIYLRRKTLPMPRADMWHQKIIEQFCVRIQRIKLFFHISATTPKLQAWSCTDILSESFIVLCYPLDEQFCTACYKLLRVSNRQIYLLTTKRCLSRLTVWLRPVCECLLPCGVGEWRFVCSMQASPRSVIWLFSIVSEGRHVNVSSSI